jgi:hypothetical protein
MYCPNVTGRVSSPASPVCLRPLALQIPGTSAAMSALSNVPVAGDPDSSHMLLVNVTGQRNACLLRGGAK